MKKNKTALTIFALTILGIGGGFTFINFGLNVNVTNEAPIYKPNPEAMDNDKYAKGLEFMEREEYEDAINSFISISSDYSKINEVKNVLLKCLILYTNDIHQKVDELVSNPNSDATAYTEAINLINGGLEYIDKLTEKEGISSDKLNSDYTYVQMLVKIYKYRKDGEPFKALAIYNENENVFIQHPSFIDFKNPIIDECRKKIDDIIDEYYSNKNYIAIIDYINGLDKEFINSYQSHKKMLKADF